MRLNIFVDETGDFGFNDKSSELYGVSFVFHEHKNNLTNDINRLNNKLDKLGYNGMIHTADLVLNRGEYRYFSGTLRKDIFNAIYQFARKILVKNHSVFVNKKYCNNKQKLRRELINEINTLIQKNIKYFKKFKKIVLYYDNGQERLGTILDETFGKLPGYEHRINFDHAKKRLFQVADMLTFIDKYNYKFKRRLKMNNSEKFFFEIFGIRNILKGLNSKRFK